MLAPGASILGRKFGYRPPRENHPLLLGAQRLAASNVILVPALVDWRPLLRPVRDQGQEGSCFAHATTALKEFNCAVWGGGTAPLGAYLSPAYVSWRTRVAEGSFPDDAGASLADAMAVLQAWGACPEAFLPYTQDPAQKGDAACDVAAQPYRIATPCVVPVDGGAFRQVLAAKHVIAIGFSCYSSFETIGPDGVAQPVPAGDPLLGGHAVLVVGYDARGFIVRNSWGHLWGDFGYAYFPDAYLAHVFEAWTSA